VILGIAKSDIPAPVQMITLALAMFCFFHGHRYSHSTPYLYKRNVHDSFGWLLISMFINQATRGFVIKIGKG
jgi:hypothetical protein